MSDRTVWHGEDESQRERPLGPPARCIKKRQSPVSQVTVSFDFGISPLPVQRNPRPVDLVRFLGE